jgi:hypothetical protein
LNDYKKYCLFSIHIVNFFYVATHD